MSAFCRWLDEQRQRKDAIGRIAKVVAYDRTFPRHSEKLTVLLKHLDKHTEHRAMLRHAHAVWRRVREHEQHAFEDLLINGSGSEPSLGPPIGYCKGSHEPEK